MAGLIHDIGFVVICGIFPNKFLSAFLRSKYENVTLHQAEIEEMGFNHANVGARLLKTWNLPKVFEEGVEFHHNPSDANKHTLEASVIHVADILADNAHSLKIGINNEASVIHPTLEEKAWEDLEMPNGIFLSTIRMQMEKEFEPMVQVYLRTA